MQGKVVLITGATGGIGKQTALSLAKLGATLVLVGRNKEVAQKAVNEIISQSDNRSIEFIVTDLSTVAGIKKLVNDFKEKYNRLDILINNAGMAAQKVNITEDGFEASFAVNVVAPYMLTLLLSDYLQASEDKKIITLTGGDLPSKIDTENLESQKSFNGLNTYSDRKITMMCVMYELANKYHDKLYINVCYPGQAATKMTQSVTKEMFPFPLGTIIFPLFRKFVHKDDKGKSAKKASRSTVYLATSEEVKGVTGKYYNKNCREKEWPKSVQDINTREYVWNYVLEKVSNKI